MKKHIDDVKLERKPMACNYGWVMDLIVLFYFGFALNLLWFEKILFVLFLPPVFGPLDCLIWFGVSPAISVKWFEKIFTAFGNCYLFGMAFLKCHFKLEERMHFIF